MKPLALLASSALLSAGVALTVATLVQPEPHPAAGSDAVLQTALRELREQQEALGARLDRLQSGIEESFLQAARTESPQVSDERIEAAVARYLQANAGAMPVEAAGSAGEFDLEKTFGELLGTNAWEHPDLWRKVHEAGRFDEVLERFRQYAKANPDSPDAQVELANALLAQLQFEPQKWPLAIEADQAFDAALKIDESHWPARFSKAVSYTFWPDFLGKRPEAIQHFETLVRQQENSAPQEHFAQTYLFLGNLYAQDGKADKAREIWARGARLFPQVQELQQKVR